MVVNDETKDVIRRWRLSLDLRPLLHITSVLLPFQSSCDAEPGGCDHKQRIVRIS
jgi:hypothetical protein